MKKDDIKTQKFSIFLFKGKYTKIEQVINKKKMIDEQQYEKLQLQDSSLSTSVQGYLKKDNLNKVAWVSKIRELFVIEDLYNTSNSLIFFVKANNRIFAFTNGYAQSVLDTLKIEWDFGLKVALNIISQDEIRGIDTRTLSLSSHQKREVSSTNSNINNFEFNIDEEFLNSITGKVNGSEVGESLFGNESLKVSVKLKLSTIVSYCEQLLSTYLKKDYQKKFAFYDKLHITKDPAIFDVFLQEVKKLLKSGNYNSMVLSYPNIEDFYYFSYRLIYQRQREDYSDINIDILASFINEKEIDIDGLDLKEFKICLIGDDGEIKKKYSLLDYLVFEFDIGRLKYIYSNRQIFNINNDFYQNVVSDIQNIEVQHLSDMNLLKVKSEIRKNKRNKEVEYFENEGEYNLRITNENKKNCICLDKRNFRDFPGRSQDQIEICDLVTKNKELLCIKIYKNSSSVMSHLFQQGFVSAVMLVEEEKYRHKLFETAKQQFGDKWITGGELIRTDFTYVYGIGMKHTGTLADNLPFFSKISLRQNIKELKKLNFNVKIVKIEIE